MERSSIAGATQQDPGQAWFATKNRGRRTRRLRGSSGGNLSEAVKAGLQFAPSDKGNCDIRKDGNVGSSPLLVLSNIRNLPDFGGQQAQRLQFHNEGTKARGGIRGH